MVVLLVAIGATTPDSLRSKRPYVIVGAFVVGMLLTPPDVISQTLLAVPVWLLYEVGVVASAIMVRNRTRNKAKEVMQGETPFSPMSDAEMDAELDRIEAEEQEVKGKS